MNSEPEPPTFPGRRQSNALHECAAWFSRPPDAASSSDSPLLVPRGVLDAHIRLSGPAGAEKSASAACVMEQIAAAHFSTEGRTPRES